MGAKCPTIGGLADQWISYIPPADEYENGGYEASVRFYGPTLGDTIREGVLQESSNSVRTKRDNKPRRAGTMPR